MTYRLRVRADRDGATPLRPPPLIRLAAWLAGPENAELRREWLDHLYGMEPGLYDMQPGPQFHARRVGDACGFVWTAFVVRMRTLAGPTRRMAFDLGLPMGRLTAFTAVGFSVGAGVDLAAGKVFAYALWLGIGAFLYFGEKLPSWTIQWLTSLLSHWFGENIACWLALWMATAIVLPMGRGTVVGVVLWTAGTAAAGYLISWSTWFAMRLRAARRARSLPGVPDEESDR